MAKPKPLLCPFCKKDKPKQHQRFCNKNPDRVRGPGRPPDTPKETPATPVTTTDSTANNNPPITISTTGSVPPPIQPDFVVADTTRKVEAMPSLEPTAAATPATPPPVPAIAVGPLVEVLCGLFDESLVKAQATEASGPPPPPGPITPAERAMLASALDPLVAKYLPMLGPYAIEITALVAVAGVFMPRLLQAKARKLWIEENKQLPPPQQPASTPSRSEEDLLRIGDKWVGRVNQA